MTKIKIKDISEWLASLTTVSDEGALENVFLLGRNNNGNMVKVPVSVLMGGEAPEEPDPNDTRGWWIDSSNNKTYFDSTATFIDNGVMSQPPWIQNAVEIRLCAGITSFKTPVTDEDYVFRFAVSGSEFQDTSNNILKVLDFGDAEVTTIPTGLISSRAGDYGDNVLERVILNDKVTKIDPWGFELFLWPEHNFTIEVHGVLTDIGDSNSPGIDNPWEGVVYFKTASENVTSLTNLVSSLLGEGKYSVSAFD